MREYGEYGWWESDAEQTVHDRLFTHVRAIEEEQLDQHLQNMLNARLYANREPMLFEWNQDIQLNFRPLSDNTDNVIQSVADTLKNRLTMEWPRPSIITRGSDFGMYQRGRKLDRFVWADFTHLGVYDKLPRLVLDSIIYGGCFMKMGIDSDEVYAERVHPDEIIVDQRECVSNEHPYSMYQRKLVSRQWLMAQYKGNTKAQQAIMEAQPKGFQYTSYRCADEDQVVLVEGWKRPSRPGAGDGRHVLCTENFSFVDEPYTNDDFPIVTMKYKEPETGYYGLSLVSDLIDFQVRLSELNDRIRRGIDLVCIPRMLYEEGSEINVTTFDNMLARGYQYRGTKPEVVSWNAFGPEVYNERQRIKDEAYEFAGLSQALAQAKPMTNQMRFDSSPAIREHKSTQDERYVDKVRSIEKFILDIAKKLIKLSAELYKTKGKSTKVTYASKYIAEEIDWADVDMDADRYVLQVSATSVLNMSVAARRDRLETWYQEGKISLAQYHAYSGQPDLERLSDIMSADGDFIEWCVQEMFEGRNVIATPLDPLEYGFSTVWKTYLRVRTMKGVKPATLNAFKNWLVAAKEIIEPSQPPVQQPLDPQGVMPNVSGIPELASPALAGQPGIGPADLSAALAGNSLAAGSPGGIPPGGGFPGAGI